MNALEYNEKLFLCRQATDRTQRIATSRIVSTLKSAYAELVDLMALKSPDTLSYQFYLARQSQIGALIEELTRNINSTIRFAVAGETTSVTDIYARLAEKYAAGTRPNFDMVGFFDTVPTDAARASLGRIWMDGRNFSARLWRLESEASTAVNEIIGKGIIRGQSAVDMSKELRRYLVNPDLSPGTTWTTAIRPSVTGRGTIYYNALRLARSEINNAYREALVQANAANPVTLGTKWNLSASHPFPDVCDIWAELDLYGLGPGVFPANAAPIDHPNGKCYFTEVLRSPKLWDEAKPEPPAQQYEREEVLAPLSSKPGVKEYHLNAAFKMWTNTQRIVGRGQFNIAAA